MRQLVAALVATARGVPRFAARRVADGANRDSPGADRVSSRARRADARVLRGGRPCGRNLRGRGRPRRSRRCSAAARTWRPHRCRMRCNWPSKGVTSADFSFSYAADRGAGGRAFPEPHDPHHSGSKRPHRWCLRSRVRESSNPQLSPGFQRSLARLGQHRVGRHVGQLCGRARAWKRRRGGLAWECDFRFESRQPRQTFLVDLRTPAGAQQVFGSEIFPSLGLLAEERWLRANPDTARRLVRAVTRGMQWVRNHSAEQVRDMVPAAARTTVKADLHAIRQLQQVLSSDGLMPPGSTALIERFVAASNPKLRAAPIDIAHIYTNEFALTR